MSSVTSNRKSNTPLIIGLTIGSIILAGLIIYIIIFMMKKKGDSGRNGDGGGNGGIAGVGIFTLNTLFVPTTISKALEGETFFDFLKKRDPKFNWLGTLTKPNRKDTYNFQKTITINNKSKQINIFPTQRKKKENVLWGYICKNSQTGAVCSLSYLSPDGVKNPDGSDIKKDVTQKLSADELIKTGINFITIFSNIWQPSLAWGEKGSLNLGDGQPTGWDSYGTEKKPVLTKDEIKQLHEAGVTCMYTIGSWDAIFPREDGKQYDPQIPTSDSWTDAAVTDFVNKLINDVDNKLFGGYLDGFDFDIEGFGGGKNPTKEGIWGKACNGCPNGGPFGRNNEEVNGAVSAKDHSIHPTGCYSFPDQGTINVLNKIFKQLKQLGYVVTLVPMSTALYTNEQNVAHNQFVKYGLDFEMVDGIMLQWYSGAGLNICGPLEDSKTTKCPNADESISADCKKLPCCNADTKNQQCDKIKSLKDLNAKLGTKNDNLDSSKEILNGNYKVTQCPGKCPRKIDCPDWYYDGEEPFESQIKLLNKLGKIPGISVPDKIVIGLESFPNLQGSYATGSGPQTFTASYWGPLPSSNAVKGLNNYLIT